MKRCACWGDEELVHQIGKARREHSFKSKSPRVEMAVKKFLEAECK